RARPGRSNSTSAIAFCRGRLACRRRDFAQLAPDCGEAATEAAEGRLSANDATPEAATGHVEGEAEAEEQGAGGEPDDGGAVVAADSEAGKVAWPGKDVLVLADSRWG